MNCKLLAVDCILLVMPELPEVETIKIGLSSLLPNRRISSVWFDWKKSFPNPEGEVDRYLIGAKIIDIHRRAKVLIINLSSKYSLVTHLRMTGQLVFVQKRELPAASNHLPVKTENRQQKTDNSKVEVRFGAGHPSKSLAGELPDKSTRVIITFNDGSKLYFNDQRKFGWMRLIPTIEVLNIDFLRSVGPEPLADDFTVDKFVDRLKRRQNSNIKSVLLDQKIVAGIGNIYADESLWCSMINPLTTVKNLELDDMNKLFICIREVLNKSIEKGGSTDRNYVDANGKKGSYLSHANVFRREGQQCYRCNSIITKIRVAGRGTHICPSCQKAKK